MLRRHPDLGWGEPEQLRTSSLTRLPRHTSKRGTKTEPETSVSSQSSIVDQALAGIVADSDEFTNLDSLKTTAYGELLGDLIGLDKDNQTPSVTIRVDPALVDAVTEHPSSTAQSRDDVVATAVLWYAGIDT